MQASCRALLRLSKTSSRLGESSNKTLCTCSTVKINSRNNSHFTNKHYQLHQCLGSVPHVPLKPYFETQRCLSLSNMCYTDQQNDDFPDASKEPDHNTIEPTEQQSEQSEQLVGERKVDSRPSAQVDIDAELLRYDYEEFDLVEEEAEDDESSEYEEVHPIPLTRGCRGVYDVGELVELLQYDNAGEICVISVPQQMEFVDHMVIVTGRSNRHLRAMAYYIKKLYKLKRSKGDPTSCKIEGEHHSSWLAMDLGNIFLHLFTSETRELYDLETLWTVGPQYDRLSRETHEAPDFSWVDAYTTDFKQFEKQGTNDKQSRIDFERHDRKSMESSKWHEM